MNLLLSLLGLIAVCAKGLEANQECSTLPSSTSSRIPDCNCRPESVENAASSFFVPVLAEICNSTFFRYFFVDLESECPFWDEEALCMMEGCSVCTCPEEEIPLAYRADDLSHPSKNQNTNKETEFGWVSAPLSSSTSGQEVVGDRSTSRKGSQSDESLGKISLPSPIHSPVTSQIITDDYTNYKEVNTAQRQTSKFFEKLYATEDCDDFDEWTQLHAPLKEIGVYVNLLQNPERYTGYSGFSAHRVWRAIKEENCFSEAIIYNHNNMGILYDEQCYEKRIFYRVISGLQASISTHIAKEFPIVKNPKELQGLSLASTNLKWGHNIPLFWHAVGNHPERLHNMYFAFLFLYRAAVKAGDLIVHYPYEKSISSAIGDIREIEGGTTVGETATGSEVYTQTQEIERVRELLKSLVSNRGDKDERMTLVSSVYGRDETTSKAVEECSYAFDESHLFQVSSDEASPMYWEELEQKYALRDEFRNRFRNISRILDCVTCEKCRLWGKLQILGIGTAIKILLTPLEDLKAPQTTSAPPILNRQEIIALVNTLHQFSKSIKFAAYAIRSKQTEGGKEAIVTNSQAQQKSESTAESPGKGSGEDNAFLMMAGILIVVVFTVYWQCSTLIYNQKRINGCK